MNIFESVVLLLATVVIFVLVVPICLLLYSVIIVINAIREIRAWIQGLFKTRLSEPF